MKTSPNLSLSNLRFRRLSLLPLRWGLSFTSLASMASTAVSHSQCVDEAVISYSRLHLTFRFGHLSTLFEPISGTACRFRIVIAKCGQTRPPH
jgi:hypothetical protein